MTDLGVAYDDFAPFYDSFTAADDYDAWFRLILEILDAHGPNQRTTVWDVGTGTGKVALRFANAGWDVVATDASAGMLELARSRLHGTRAQVFRSDIREHPLSSKVDVVTAIDDVFNHLLTEEDATSAASNIARSLNPSGLLIFDVNTARTYRDVFSRLHVSSSEDEVLIMEPGPQPYATGQVVSCSISSYRLVEGMWTKRVTRQVQKHHTPDDVRSFLRTGGLELVAAYGLRPEGRLDKDADENRHGKVLYAARAHPRATHAEEVRT